MARYLLDTTALIDYTKRHEPAYSRIVELAVAGEELGVCAVNVAEFYSGVPAQERSDWDEFLESLEYWDIAPEAARNAGFVRYDFARNGIALSTTDTLIAATALERQAIVVTDNPRHFPMSGLQIISLR